MIVQHFREIIKFMFVKNFVYLHSHNFVEIEIICWEKERKLSKTFVKIIAAHIIIMQYNFIVHIF